MEFKDQILEEAHRIHEQIIKIRRDIHMNPELGEEVPRTAKVAEEALNALGIKTRTKVGKTGVLGDLVVNPQFRTIALRADMDALPIYEQSNTEYKSKIDGKAHMCGHDSHTAMLIGAAQIISKFKDQLKANVRFVFQPAEEVIYGGAPAMIEEGALEGVDEIYGLHVWPLQEVGKFATRIGPLLAQNDEFYLEIQAVGGHAAYPQAAIDPIVIGSHFVQSIQTIVSRNIDPLESAVISITQFNSGEGAVNVIPPSVKIGASVRMLSMGMRQVIKDKLTSILEGFKTQYGINYHLDYKEGYPVTFNHKETTEFALGITEDLVGNDNVKYPCAPEMGSEDFSYYSQKIPATFIFLGSGNKERGIVKMCHHPEFDIDENCMTYGMALHAGLALNFK